MMLRQILVSRLEMMLRQKLVQQMLQNLKQKKKMKICRKQVLEIEEHHSGWRIMLWEQT
jgi:hypothetical protein